jgi:co-chaperonin GroES (HSP10)
MIKTTTSTVLYTKRHVQELKAGNIILTQHLSMDTQWCDVVVTGPESILQSGDEILLSRRPVSYEFVEEGIKMYNTSDASTMAFKRDGKLGATAGTILYEWLEEKEEKTESGIILVQKAATKELEPRWALVVACGPDSGVLEGNHVLLAFKSDAYNLDIDGRKLHNAGASEVIAFKVI